MAAVVSCELGSLSLQLCRVTNVRNSNVCLSRQYKLFLNHRTGETLAQCCRCESKLVMSDSVLQREEEKKRELFLHDKMRDFISV